MRLIKNDKIVPIFDHTRPLPAFYITGSLTIREKTDLISAYDHIFKEEERRRKLADEFIKKNFQA